MTVVLGQDFGADALDLFGDELYKATLHKKSRGAYTAGAETSGTNPTVATYVCDAIAFGYKQRYVDGEHIKKGDYRVVIIRTSIGTQNSDGVKASLDLATVTADINTVVQAKLIGPDGDFITIAFVGDAGLQAGSIGELGKAVTIHFLPGATTVADVETLLATSTLVEVKTAGTAGHVLQAADAIAASPLDGGANPTVTPVNVVPNPGDEIDIPPPGQTASKTGVVVLLEVLTEAQITVQCRGPGV